MIPLAFDTETALIRPALLAPPMVCLTWQQPNGQPGILHVSEAHYALEAWLRDPRFLFVGHFAAYDMAVICAEFPDLIPAVFAAYRAGRVTCTKKRQQLLDIAGGVFRGRPGEKGKWIVHKYDLGDLARRHLGKTLQKDTWRLLYAEFRDIPLEQWPAHARTMQARAAARRAEIAAAYPPGTRDIPDAVIDELKHLDALLADDPNGVIQYPLDDASAALGVFMSQERHAEYLKDQFRQSYADFVLYLSSTWGLRTHADGVAALKAELQEAYDDLAEELTAAGLVRPNGTRNMRAVKDAMIAACRDLGVALRRTDGHTKCELGDACDEHVALDADACDAIVAAYATANGTEDLEDFPLGQYAEFSTLGKMLSNDVAMLEAGTTYPVHTRYDIAETGRTTSRKPAIQNLNTGRVKNKKSTAQRLRKGVRQAFIPRPGRVFAQADFPQLELYTLAQCCMSWLGTSRLAEALNGGLDPHLAMAATILGISYEEAKKRKKDPDVDHARQTAKVANFGFPGGLGAPKLVLYARKTYDVTLTVEQAKALKEQWLATWPEMRGYFARVNTLFGDEVERASVCTLFTERWRGGATYCAACNNGFQALGVDCAKQALCRVAEAEYVAPPDGPTSPLFGSRTVAFVHDELIVETDDAPTAHDAAFELARLMVEGANVYLPNVPIPLAKMEPTLMRCWSKEAKQVFDSNGRLVPWSP
jgi:DNA polymerase-1